MHNGRAMAGARDASPIIDRIIGIMLGRSNGKWLTSADRVPILDSITTPSELIMSTSLRSSSRRNSPGAAICLSAVQLYRGDDAAGRFYRPRARDPRDRIRSGREQARFQYFCHRTYRHRQNQYHQSLSQENYQPANHSGWPIAALPEDWCYVYTLPMPIEPLALRIRRGWGKVLKADMEQFVQSVQREAKNVRER